MALKFHTYILYCYLILKFGHALPQHDFRFISRNDLKSSITTFFHRGTSSYSQMLFDISSNEILVSSKNTIFRLSLSELDLLEHASWKASKDNIGQCLTKGQSDELCQNYIEILQRKGDKLFACGTNAFHPQCTWRKLRNISEVTEQVSGIAKCPYNPHSNYTSLILENGDFYYGGPTDFSGSESLLSKTTASYFTVKTRQYSPMWLNEPQFVGSFETNQFVYIIFREAAVEYMNCGKIIYSRIARVCKNDVGAHNLNGEIWSTFIKARLNCSISGDYPFYFNEIQSISYVAEESLVYGIFTTPSNGLGGSAICAFNLSSINNAFNGPFKHQENIESAWHASSTSNHHREHLQCKSVQTKHFFEASKYQLMDSAVEPITLNPLHVAKSERFTHITTDIVSTKIHKAVHVIYVTTLEGVLKKITILPRTQETCIVEIVETPGIGVGNPIKSMQFVKQTNSIYLTTNENVMKISVDHCGRHNSKNSCLNSMDPYCGWNERDERCSLPPDGNPLNEYWEQSIISCPRSDLPVDGGWSSWSPWARCEYTNSDTCLCQQRFCNNPTPVNGGKQCTGVSISVTNCTVHGGWTDWSAWSACSQTCGQATKIRSRTCTNPAPAFGGRVCVGQSIMEAYCSELLPCPIQPKNGGWSGWEPWSSCSSSHCTFRKRKRKCNNPRPEDGGQFCIGNDTEYEECKDCEDREKHYTTEWFKNSTRFKRFKFVCKLKSNDIRISVKEEMQVCKNKNHCYEIMQKSKWSAWTVWSSCSVECGDGIQNRTRYCEGKGCQGPLIEVRQCSKPPCIGEWGCWSEWSPCNASCGWGVQVRTRNCLTSNCKGIERETQPCELAPCESLLGWENWSAWSLCDENNEQHRKRKCRTNNPAAGVCQGSAIETRICVTASFNLSEKDELQSASMSIGMAFAYFFIGATLGLTSGILTVHTYMKKKKTKIPSSPHYINTKPNPYVTVPLHDKSKKLNSAATHSNIMNNFQTGTLKSMKCYDDTTTKRANGQSNGHNKMELLNDDKFYYD